MLVAAAKLGRRSHKMRELISEATRTVEDSQTAQALHGLLSLKSPADCPPTASSTVLTSVGELSLELIQQSPTGLAEHEVQIQAAGVHDADVGSAKTPTKSPSWPAMSSKSVDRHAALRAAILSPSATGLQPATAGAAGSAVQILLQMQQDDACNAGKGNPLRAKLASSSARNVSVVPTSSPVGVNTTHVLLDRSVPVKVSTPSSTAKAASASLPLSSVVQVSDSTAGQAVPIQLIATSQGVLAIPQNYKLVPQNAVAAMGCVTTAVSTARVTQPAIAAVASPPKRRLSAATSASGLLKIAKLQTAAVTQSQGMCDANSTVVQSEPTIVVANSLPHTINEGVLSHISSLPNQPLRSAIRDSYEKLFWKVYLQSSSFQSMPRPPDGSFNGSSEVSPRRQCIKSCSVVKCTILYVQFDSVCSCELIFIQCKFYHIYNCITIE